MPQQLVPFVFCYFIFSQVSTPGGIVIHSRADPVSGYPGFTSTDLDKTQIENYLNNQSYNQGVLMWEITRLPAMTIYFDLNQDGKYDDVALGNFTDEQLAILTNVMM